MEFYSLLGLVDVTRELKRRKNSRMGTFLKLVSARGARNLFYPMLLYKSYGCVLYD